jgi:hypothetical protein
VKKGGDRLITTTSASSDTYLCSGGEGKKKLVAKNT